MLELRRRHIGLVHFHKIDVDEEWLTGVFSCGVEELECGLLYVTVKERDAYHTLVWRIDVLPVDLEVFLGRLARDAGQ